jgi:uncharacterized protein YjlB
MTGRGSERPARPADRFRSEGLHPTSWRNGPGETYGAHEHEYDKVIVVERGSIRFGLGDGRDVADLAAGDRLELPAGTRHDARVGADGVACLEGHLPAGSLAALRILPDGEW